jgi:hypothetical protein
MKTQLTATAGNRTCDLSAALPFSKKENCSQGPYFFYTRLAAYLFLSMDSNVFVEVGTTGESFAALWTGQVAADVQAILLAHHAH